MRKSLTVLFIFSGDLWAGAEVMIFNLLNKLKYQPEIEIIALSLNEGTLTKKLRDIGIETYVLPESKYSFLRIVIKAFRLFIRRKTDIIHSHRYKENLLALLLSKTMRVKRLVSTMHGLQEAISVGNNWDNKSQSLSLIMRMNFIALRYFFSDVVVVSNEMKKTLVEKYSFNHDRVKVIYNGIPSVPNDGTFNFLSGPRNNEFHIGTVGRMVPIKNFSLFLKIAAMIKSRVKEVRFSILGDGPLKRDLILLAKELMIENDIEFLSPRVNPFSYYRSLDLYLSTSLHEGIPLSILEAMSFGVPVVAPKVGGIPEIISHEKNGFLIDGHDPTAYLFTCIKLMQNANIRKTIARNAPRRITTIFNDYHMATSYIALYKQSNLLQAP